MPVNQKNVAKLLAALKGEDKTLEKLDVGFNMAMYIGSPTLVDDDKTGRDCGTVACIAGTCAILSRRSNKERKAVAAEHRLVDSDIHEVARRWLGLSHKEAARLFFAQDRDRRRGDNLQDISLRRAINTVQRLHDTGEVRWA